MPQAPEGSGQENHPLADKWLQSANAEEVNKVAARPATSMTPPLSKQESEGEKDGKGDSPNRKSFKDKK